MDRKILIAGHTGLAGSAIVRMLEKQAGWSLYRASSKEVDFTNQLETFSYVHHIKPEYVIIAAAKVGGILANASFPADFIYQNLMITANLIEACKQVSVKRLIYLGSSCIYPKFATQPIKEDCLLSGPLEDTNRAYAIAKIAGVEICRSYNHQYGTEYLAVMPTNLFGPRDTYDPKNSHVLPALILKMHIAKVSGATSLSLWGTGKPLREFLYSDDLADALLYLFGLSDQKWRALTSDPKGPLINVGSGKEISIHTLSMLVKKIVGYEGVVDWDSNFPDGTPRKLLDNSKLSGLGWQPKVSLEYGIRLVYNDFLTQRA